MYKESKKRLALRNSILACEPTQYVKPEEQPVFKFPFIPIKNGKRKSGIVPKNVNKKIPKLNQVPIVSKVRKCFEFIKFDTILSAYQLTNSLDIVSTFQISCSTHHLLKDMTGILKGSLNGRNVFVIYHQDVSFVIKRKVISYGVQDIQLHGDWFYWENGCVYDEKSIKVFEPCAKI